VVKKSKSKRVFVIRIDEISEATLEQLLDKLKIKEAYIRISPRKKEAIIKLVGFEGDIRDTWSDIKSTLRKQRFRETCTALISDLFKEVGGTFPPDVLVEALRIRGFKAEVFGDCIVSDAEKNLLVDIARKIIEAMQTETLRFNAKGKSTRKLLLIAIAGYNLSPTEAVELLLREELVKKVDEGTVMIAKNLREAVEILTRKYSLR